MIPELYFLALLSHNLMFVRPQMQQCRTSFPKTTAANQIPPFLQPPSLAGFSVKLQRRLQVDGRDGHIKSGNLLLLTAKKLTDLSISALPANTALVGSNPVATTARGWV